VFQLQNSSTEKNPCFFEAVLSRHRNLSAVLVIGCCKHDDERKAGLFRQYCGNDKKNP